MCCSTSPTSVQSQGGLWPGSSNQVTVVPIHLAMITNSCGTWNQGLTSPLQTSVPHWGLQMAMREEDLFPGNHSNGTWTSSLDAERGSREFGPKIVEMCCSTSRRSDNLKVASGLGAQTWGQWSQWVSSQKQVFRTCLSSIWTHCHPLIHLSMITNCCGIWNQGLTSPLQTSVPHLALQKAMRKEGHFAGNHYNSTWTPSLCAERGLRKFGTSIIEICCTTSRRSV